MTKKNSDCIVVIPTHKDTMTSEEERSLRNTLDVLRNWPIALVLKCDVSPDIYEAVRSKEELQFEIIHTRPDWMGSLERYNDMGLSPEFYRMFEPYKYILICHLDAWVFRDDLQAWIDKGYDYLGAPWVLLRDSSSWVSPGNGLVPLETLMYPQGGNGGFSLRKVKKMIELTSKPKRSLNILLFIRTVLYYLKNRQKDLLKTYINDCREVLRDPVAFQKKYGIYEDRMFSMFYSLIDRNFRVAPAKEELFFATEVYSEEILKTKLKWQLPFAIHGYEKYLPSSKSIDEYREDKNRNDYTRNIRNTDTQKLHKNRAPLITVITPTCNLIQAGRTETFRQCMESVHQQTYNNIEHIIIDGASSDGTLGLIQEYVDKGWCVCFSEPDDGIWDALCKGHQRANGQFVNYMNSDDCFCRTDAIEIAANSLIKNNADWFFSGGMLIFEDGSSMPFPTSPYGAFSCMGILHQTMLVRTDILNAMNPFQSDHITRENYLMVLLLTNRFSYSCSKEILVQYRVGGFSTGDYGGHNTSRTINDFGNYFFNSAGRFWGMSEIECRSMFTWQCFELNGVEYSYKVSKKLRIRGLRFAFRKRLAIYILKNKKKSLLKWLMPNAVINYKKKLFPKLVFDRTLLDQQIHALSLSNVAVSEERNTLLNQNAALLSERDALANQKTSPLIDPLHSNSTITVAYLARRKEGVESFRRFLNSYRNIPSGVNHQLVIVYKGFEGDTEELEKAKAIFSEVRRQSIYVSDIGLDIGAYLYTAHMTDSSYICFLNTHTTIRAPNWLLFLLNAATTPGIGLVGSTASYESLSDSFAMTTKASWLFWEKNIPIDASIGAHFYSIINARAQNFPTAENIARIEELAARIKNNGKRDIGNIKNVYPELEDEWSKYWNSHVLQEGPYHFLAQISRFPNAHIRTNSFMINREWLITHFPSIEPSKEAAFIFESGVSGLSNTVLKHGLSLSIVDRHGKLYRQNEWNKSRTFRLFDQDGLTIEDNQTRSFEQMSQPERNLHTMMSWGTSLVSDQSVPNFGFPFHTNESDR